MGHQGSVERKVQSIEYLDGRVIGPLKEKLSASGEPFRMLIMPDHPTPICVRTHTSDPVPYLLYDSSAPGSYSWKYNEREAQKSGKRVDKGYKMIDYLFSGQ